MSVNGIGKCVEFAVKTKFKSMIISQSVSIVRIVSKEKLRSKMAPTKLRQSTRNQVNQNTSKSNPKKPKLSEKNDSDVASASDEDSTKCADPELVKIIESAQIEIASMKKAVAPEEKELDDDDSDDEFTPGTSASKNSRKRNSSSGQKSTKKKDLEFEDKRKVAIAISKHANLYDVRNPKYSDKRVENAAWKTVSASVKLPIAVCMKHWTSLKRSANYYARPARIPFKSGAGADEMKKTDDKKYKDEWQFADVMNFYTAPSLKEHEKLISVCNTVTQEKIDESNEVLFGTKEIAGANAMENIEYVDVDFDNIYVSKISRNILTDFLNENERILVYVPNRFFPSNHQGDVLMTSSKPKQKDVVSQSFATMANSFSSYLATKSTELPSEKTTQLKHYAMWSHFDVMISKFDDDAIEDLNIDIMKLIGDAIKAQRQKSSKVVVMP